MPQLFDESVCKMKLGDGSDIDHSSDLGGCRGEGFFEDGLEVVGGVDAGLRDLDLGR